MVIEPHNSISKAKIEINCRDAFYVTANKNEIGLLLLEPQPKLGIQRYSNIQMSNVLK